MASLSKRMMAMAPWFISVCRLTASREGSKVTLGEANGWIKRKRFSVAVILGGGATGERSQRGGHQLINGAISVKRPTAPRPLGSHGGHEGRASWLDLTVSLLQARLIDLNLPINVEVCGSLGDCA